MTRPTTAGIASRVDLPMTLGASWRYTFKWPESNVEGAPKMDLSGFKGRAELRDTRDNTLVAELTTENGGIEINNDADTPWSVAVNMTETQTDAIVTEGERREMRADVLLYDDGASPRFTLAFIEARVVARRTSTVLP